MPKMGKIRCPDPLLAAFLVVLWTGPLLAQSSAPRAPTGDHVDVLHGERVVDPFRWLEDLNAERTLDWVRAQDSYAREFARAYSEHEALGRRMARIADIQRYRVPQVAGGREFYLRFPASGGPGTGPGTVLLMADPTSGSETLLIDPESEPVGPNAYLSRAIPDRDGERVAYGMVPGGSSWETLRVREVVTGEDLSDELTGVHAGRSSITWTADGRGFYYDRLPPPTPEAERTARLGQERVYYHELGTPQESDRLSFELPDHPDWPLTHRLSDDGRYLLFGATDPSTGHNTVFYRDLSDIDGEAVPLIEEPDAIYALAGNDGSVLWFYTDLDAPRGRVIAIDVRRPEREHWRELIPEAEETISSWVRVRAIGDRLLVGYLKDALNVVRVFDSTGRFLYDLDLPSLGSIWSGFVGRQDSPYAHYSLSGLADPGSIYRLDVRTGTSELVRRPEMDHDPDDFVTEQVFYTSYDGTRVPMFLVRRRDDGPHRAAPVFMYGYGFGAWSAAPWFQAHMVLWLEMGGIWALPNTRGGGAYGEEWHRAGSRRQKQTAIDDYLAATEWLIEQGYTTRELMVANASSAGGAIAGAAIVQRPDLYGAAVIDYPVLDMLRYHRFTGASSWTSEYGTAEDPDDFRALRAYSPYHNIETGTCYPPTLVAPGERDQTTPPLHAYKFVAALQHAQACDDPILLRVSWGAGHSSGADLQASIETWTDQLAFLARVLQGAGWRPDI